MRNILLLLLFLGSGYTLAGEKLRYTPGDPENCFDTRLEACQAFAASGAWEFEYPNHTMVSGTANIPNSNTCAARFNPGYHNFTLSDDGFTSCTIPQCIDYQGDTFTTSLDFPNNEGYEDKGFGLCYFSCQLDGQKLIEGEKEYTCTYNGTEVQDPNATPYPNIDTHNPNYCDVVNSDGSCADVDHPDNDGGCAANGRVYGTYGPGDGVTGCFPTGSDYEPEENTESGPDDIDGDGVPDYNDGDIDGDGTPNSQDNDADGDGVDNADDPTPFGGGSCQDGKCPESEDEDGDGEEDGKGKGTATDCNSPPTSEGDPQLAAIHQQLWINECKSGEVKAEGYNDCSTAFKCEGDPVGCAQLRMAYNNMCAAQDLADGIDGLYDEQGGEGGISYDSVMSDFNTRVSNSAIYSGVSSFFDVSLTGGCPRYQVDTWVFDITLDQWCDPDIPWGAIGGIILAVCSPVAVRIAFT